VHQFIHVRAFAAVEQLRREQLGRIVVTMPSVPMKTLGFVEAQRGCETKEITGNPDPKHISTSYVERQNLTMRISMRRFTRLTNAFSKKVENHAAAVALYFMYDNFGRVHETLRVTPAMEAGVASHVRSVEEIVGLLG